MARTGEWLIRIAGLLIFAGAFAHALAGLPQLMRELPPDLALATRQAVATGWAYGSFTMLTLGALVLFGRGKPAVGGTRAIPIPLGTGLAKLTYGTWALIYTGMRPHFWSFVIIGVMLLTGVALSKRAERAARA